MPTDGEITLLATRAVDAVLNYKNLPVTVALGNDFGYGTEDFYIESEGKDPIYYIVEADNSYKSFADKYGSIFTGKAYEEFTDGRFSDANGQLRAEYFETEAVDYSLDGVSAEFVKKTDGGYIYMISYTVTYGIDYDSESRLYKGTATETKKAEVTAEKTEDGLKISEAANLF